MLGIALILLPIMYTDMKISRKEGAFFTIVYIAYTIILIQAASTEKLANKQKQQIQTVSGQEQVIPSASAPIALPAK